MSPMQQIFLGLGAVATKTYVDDVFSTFVYDGISSTKTITNGIDLAGEGGMVWFKSRSHSQNHTIYDTVRGIKKSIMSDDDGGQTDETSSSYYGIDQFNNNGFRTGYYNPVNSAGKTYTSWSFRKSPGLFDVVTWTGNGNGSRQISHSLESVPGCIMIKRTDDSYGWYVYHRGLDSSNPERYYLRLNETAASQNTTGQQWMAAAPTSTNFTLAADIAGSGWEGLNTNGQTYVAYVFAGGESTAATARSVDFDGSGDYLVVYNQADLSPEDGDFTCEMWIKPDSWSTGDSLVYASSSGFSITRDGSNNALKVGMAGSTTHLTSTSLPEVGQWTHVAVARSGTTMRLFFDGVLNKSETVSHNYASPVTMYIVGGGGEFNGKISNFRFVKGTAVYTSSFRPPTEPLANITNTKLLCCNGSSTNSSTVTPGTLNAEGNPTASTDSPFDDPSGFVFGESGSENVIKCGSYKGSSSAGLEVNVGWEPSWLMIKVTSRTGDWYIMDSMRGVVTSGNDEYLKANDSDVEGSADVIEFTSTGFKVISTGTHWNNSAETYSFTAIRRSDGYVGKPVELGTGVFAMDTGAGSSTIPNFDSGFPVDLAITRAPADTTNWETGGRLIQGKWLETNRTVAESPGSYFTFDSNTGWMSGATAYNSSYQAWMWKRHAGLDVVTYAGSEMTGGRQIPHSMGVTPEMMWVFRRNGDDNWAVYHKGLNGSTNPEQYDIHLNLTNAEANNTTWNDTAPTATHFSVSPNSNEVNQDNKDYIAMLFASVSGISSVGSYTGPNPEATITIDCGFQPRFVMIKCSSHARDWVVFDTVRGIAAGADKKLALNLSTAQVTTEDMIDLTSSGFSLPHGTYLDTNWAGREFIYYAHA
jgi:hypothetical protein